MHSLQRFLFSLTAPASEPVFQKSITPKVESQPFVRVSSRTQPAPVHRPDRAEPLEPAKVVEQPKKAHRDDDIDMLRPDPTRNALARARQMLDKLEMEDEERWVVFAKPLALLGF